MNYDQLMDWGRRNGAGTQVLMAKKLRTTQVTISRWRREGVPRYRQYELHVLSGGELPVDEAAYEYRLGPESTALNQE